MLRKGAHDTNGKQRIVARLRMRLADDLTATEAEMIGFVYVIVLFFCRIAAQQHRYNVSVCHNDFGRHFRQIEEVLLKFGSVFARLGKIEGDNVVSICLRVGGKNAVTPRGYDMASRFS